jgi:CRP-like cAMP-binding protein
MAQGCTVVKQRRLRLLQEMPIFGGLSQQALEFILEDAPVVSRAAGESFFRDGDEGHAVFVLERGRVAVIRRWRQRPVQLAELGPGACFGEMALIDFQPRSATVAALESSRAIELSAARVHSLYEYDLKQFTLVQMNMSRELSRRLRHSEQHLLDVAADLPGARRLPS